MRLLKSLARRVRGVTLAYKHRTPADKTKPSVCIQINEHVYTRYLYLLVKFFKIAGWQVYLRASPETISRIYTCSYSRFIFKENLVSMMKPQSVDIEISETKVRKLAAKKRFSLSPDYFQIERFPTFRVPMAQHPMLYVEKLWDKPIKSKKRLNACFTYGNFDSAIYHEITRDNLFPVCNRTDLKDYLSKNFRVHILKSLDDLENEDLEGKLVIADLSVAGVPIANLRETLSRFRYFLSLPGAAMPHSHNATEAMSTGTVPIIELWYARDFEPSLENNINSLFYEGTSNILSTFDAAFAKSDEEYDRLSRAVQNCYDSHLTPTSVIFNLAKSECEGICLQAEHKSVELLKRRSNRDE